MGSISCSIAIAKLGFSKSMEGSFILYQVRPSMTANTPEDSELKIGLVDDVMTLINVEGM